MTDEMHCFTVRRVHDPRPRWIADWYAEQPTPWHVYAYEPAAARSEVAAQMGEPPSHFRAEATVACLIASLGSWILTTRPDDDGDEDEQEDDISYTQS